MFWKATTIDHCLGFRVGDEVVDAAEFTAGMAGSRDPMSFRLRSLPRHDHGHGHAGGRPDRYQLLIASLGAIRFIIYSGSLHGCSGSNGRAVQPFAEFFIIHHDLLDQLQNGIWVAGGKFMQVMGA